MTEQVFSEQLLLLQAKLALTGEQHQRHNRAAEAYLLYAVHWKLFVTKFLHTGCGGCFRCLEIKGS